MWRMSIEDAIAEGLADDSVSGFLCVCVYVVRSPRPCSSCWKSHYSCCVYCVCVPSAGRLVVAVVCTVLCVPSAGRLVVAVVCTGYWCSSCCKSHCSCCVYCVCVPFAGRLVVAVVCTVLCVPSAGRLVVAVVCTGYWCSSCWMSSCSCCVYCVMCSLCWMSCCSCCVYWLLVLCVPSAGCLDVAVVCT